MYCQKTLLFTSLITYAGLSYASAKSEEKAITVHTSSYHVREGYVVQTIEDLGNRTRTTRALTRPNGKSDWISYTPKTGMHNAVWTFIAPQVNVDDDDSHVKKFESWSYDNAIVSPTIAWKLQSLGVTAGAIAGWFYAPTIGRYASTLAQGTYNVMADKHPAVQGAIALSALTGVFATVWTMQKINKTVQKRMDPVYRSGARNMLGAAAVGACMGAGAPEILNLFKR